MARRGSSKGLGQGSALWIAPLFVIVMAPIYIHTSFADDLSEVTDETVLSVLGIFFAVCGMSLLGCCAMNAGWSGSKALPLVVFLVQMVFVVFGIVLLDASFGSGTSAQLPVHGAHAQKFLRPSSSGESMPQAGQQFASAPGQATVDLPTDGGQVEIASKQRAESIASPGSSSNDKVQAQSQSAKLWPRVLHDRSGLPVWRDAGDGYCEDGNTADEFNSLHATGMTLEACADAGISDSNSIAFDFSPSDGGCDVRYPAGSLFINMEGFEWFGWGGGTGKPVGHGKLKHGAATHCYKKAEAKPAVHKEAKPAHALTTKLHPYYHALIQEYAFKPVRTDRGAQVNIILVRAPPGEKELELYNKYKDELLFIGISCLEDFPLPPTNPFSPHYPPDKFVGMFPGFLNMYRNPENIYPSHVKILDMSQSDFYLPEKGQSLAKKYDFTFSGSDQDIGQDMISQCVGWSMHCKNWSFAKQALEVMCGELGMTGVLVATKDKQNEKRCSIPSSCEGKMIQTTYLANQNDFFSYVKQSRFLFLPQVHDASPRVATQALALDVPLLMNRNLIGGWKYLNEKTGESFNDLSDFRDSVRKLLRNVEAGNVYEPRKWVTANYGTDIAGARFKNWIIENFGDRVKLPEHTRLLLSGA